LFGDAPTGSSARGEGRATFNQKPKAQQQAPNPVPQQANMPSYGHSPLNVPYQPPVVNPATAMQQQPQRPNPVPPPPTQPPAAPQPVPQQQMPMQQPAPQPQMQQPPQDANEGLRMWQEIHGNAQKSVIDGMNIVERYRKKMAMRGR